MLLTLYTALILYMITTLLIIMARKKGPEDITLQRISKTNVDKVLAIESMQAGDSINDVFTRYISKCGGLAEDVKRCLAGDVPQTEELNTLKYLWQEEAIGEHERKLSYLEVQEE